MLYNGRFGYVMLCYSMAWCVRICVVMLCATAMSCMVWYGMVCHGMVWYVMR